MRRTPLLKTLLTILALLAAANLARYSMEFSGSWWAWAALVANVVVLAASFGALLYDFWSDQ
jgi:hypothetical protein